MDKIRAERILILVRIVFTLADRGRKLRRVLQNGLQAFVKRQLRVGGHALGQLFALGKRDRGRCEQALVEPRGGIRIASSG